MLKMSRAGYHKPDQRYYHILTKYKISDTSKRLFRFWVDNKARVVYPDKQYTKFVTDTDALTKMYLSDIKLPIPCLYLAFPLDLKLHILERESCISGVILKSRHDGFDLMCVFSAHPPLTLELDALNENGNKTLEEILEECRPDLKDDKLFIQTKVLLNVVMNYLLLFQQLPEYFTKDKQRYYPEYKTSSHEYVYRQGSELSLIQRVGNCSKKNSSTSSKSSPEQHWRRAHWRRQIHGPNWAKDNVDYKGKLGEKDGRPYHLVYIPTVLVNKGTL